MGGFIRVHNHRDPGERPPTCASHITYAKNEMSAERACKVLHCRTGVILAGLPGSRCIFLRRNGMSILVDP